jgi:predicted RNase H-like HicB family nuclease
MTQSARTTYRVTVTRERDAWLADVPDVPGAHTFAHSLSTLERNIREVIVLMTDRPDEALDDFDLDVRYEIGDNAAVVATARQARAAASACG